MLVILRVSKLDENILKHCKKLKAISRHGVGIDNVDLDYIKKNNISLLSNSYCKCSSSCRTCYVYVFISYQKQ